MRNKVAVWPVDLLVKNKGAVCAKLCSAVLSLVNSILSSYVASFHSTVFLFLVLEKDDSDEMRYLHSMTSCVSFGCGQWDGSPGCWSAQQEV